jgi:vitamin-K-epoxide reductase (warfarin-sensitive)
MLIIIGVVGLCISVYGIIVERNILQNEQYKAACDISDKVSCTKTFVSPYNKLLGISNIWASLFYYCAILFLAGMGLTSVLLMFSFIGLVISAVFAYILYFKIRTLCLICTSLYIINIALVFAAYCA